MLLCVLHHHNVQTLQYQIYKLNNILYSDLDTGQMAGEKCLSNIIELRYMFSSTINKKVNSKI